MPGIRVLLISGVLALSLLLISACTPLVNYPGQPVLEPRIDNNHFVAGDGALLPVRSWLPVNKPVKTVIVGVHGFNDYSNSFAFPASYLIRYGIAFYAYDQRGFGSAPGKGLWSGVDAYTHDLSGFVHEIRNRHPDVPLYILGESMGGAVTIVMLTGNNPPPVDGVILVAPAVWGRETMPWYQRWLLAVASHTLPWLELTGSGLNNIPSDNLEVRKALHYDPQVIKGTRVDAMYGLTNLMDKALTQAEKLQVPALIQYGKHDRIIPKEPMLQMLEKMLPTSRKAFYEQGYHMLLRDMHREKPLIDIASWITDHNRPLPYGTADWNENQR
ncbi:MAG: lysophospholipase [Desulfuromonadales bacterium]|nr:lysophospholipase [Desulfuromonadales bacterium]